MLAHAHTPTIPCAKLIIKIIICIINCRGALRESYYGMLLYIIYLLIATLGECSFFAPYSNLFGMTIGYLIATRRYEEVYSMVEKYLPSKIIRGGVSALTTFFRGNYPHRRHAGYTP